MNNREENVGSGDTGQTMKLAGVQTAQESIREAFTGPINAPELSFRYRAGLFVVAFMMILLPTIYASLIGATGYLVYVHATHNLGILSGSGGGFAKAIIYFGPMIAGIILVCFMIKPFFAPKSAQAEKYSLKHEDQPLLFAFIGQICQIVSAPPPSRVDVNCEVNASASFRRGLASIASNDVVLTIGLPLVAGMSLREFSGVLAHEFGHFAQGGGMRLTYLIRSINGWFARVVYERDEWDMQLEKAAKEVDIRIGIMLHLARFSIWITRRILWILMQAGHAISCFMLRQMEYDADTYETKVAGSAVFPLTTLRIQTLNIASQAAYAEIRESWNSKRLPDDVPALIIHKSNQIPAETMDKVRLTFSERKTGLFDTHPADSDRVRASIEMNEPGVFESDLPATSLFAEFPELSRKVTRFHYEKEHELEIEENNLVSTEQTLRESDIQAAASRAMSDYFGGLNIRLRPIFITEIQTIPLPNPQESLDRLAQTRNHLMENRPRFENLTNEYSESDQREEKYSTALRLVGVGCAAKASDFELSEWSVLAATQAKTAASHQKKTIGNELASVESNACNRLSAALQLLQCPEVMDRLGDAEQIKAEASELVRCVDAISGVWPTVNELTERIGTLNILFGVGDSGDQQKVYSQITRIAPEIVMLVSKNLTGLQRTTYPFAHAKGRISIAEYARVDETYSNEIERAYREGGIHTDRLCALYFRVMGRLVLIAQKVEAAVLPLASV